MVGGSLCPGGPLYPTFPYLFLSLVTSRAYSIRLTLGTNVVLLSQNYYLSAMCFSVTEHWRLPEQTHGTALQVGNSERGLKIDLLQVQEVMKFRTVT